MNNGNKQGAAIVYHKDTFRITKIVQVSAMKVHFQIAERSLFYLNPDIHLRRMTYPPERDTIIICLIATLAT